METQIDEILEGLKKVKELNRLNIEDLNKIIEEEKAREVMKDLRYWEAQYKFLSRQLITDNLKLMNIQSRSKDCNDKLEHVVDIIKEYKKKENNKIHIQYLQDYLDVE